MPTFASLTGYAIPEDRIIDGIDQTNLLLGRTETGRETFAYDQISTPNLAFRWRNWKLLVPGRKGEKKQGYLMDFGTNDYELYDLQKDVGETKNVIEQHPEVAERLKKLLEQHVQSANGETLPQGIRLPDKKD